MSPLLFAAKTNSRRDGTLAVPMMHKDGGKNGTLAVSIVAVLGDEGVAPPVCNHLAGSGVETRFIASLLPKTSQILISI